MSYCNIIIEHLYANVRKGAITSVLEVSNKTFTEHQLSGDTVHQI